jgi:cobalt-precorrin-5B (C1)-methyltransferase
MTAARRKKLKTGFTTGTAAAAAAKAAMQVILEEKFPPTVHIRLLTGDYLDIAVESAHRIDASMGEARVIKDAGDDPDVTHKAVIGACVTLTDESTTYGAPKIEITGAEGVGTVTKPGLEITPGLPAINPGPRLMITEAVSDALRAHGTSGKVLVEIFVPEGETIAKKTLNARLGILGGISILGTTGLVKPMSHAAYIATIKSAIAVAHATGNKQLFFTTGRRSERFAQNRWPDIDDEAFVQIGDFFEKSLVLAAEKRIERIVLAVFFGKAVKMAQGVAHTHAAKSQMSLEQLARWTIVETSSKDLSDEVKKANTARHALEILRAEGNRAITRVGNEMVLAATRFAGPQVKVTGIIFDYDGSTLFRSPGIDY